MENNKKLLLTVLEAEELTGISKSKIYELIRDRIWPSVKIGTAIRVPLAGLEAWIAEASENAAR